MAKQSGVGFHPLSPWRHRWTNRDNLGTWMSITVTQLDGRAAGICCMDSGDLEDQKRSHIVHVEAAVLVRRKLAGNEARGLTSGDGCTCGDWRPWLFAREEGEEERLKMMGDV